MLPLPWLHVHSARMERDRARVKVVDLFSLTLQKILIFVRVSSADQDLKFLAVWMASSLHKSTDPSRQQRSSKAQQSNHRMAHFQVAARTTL